MGNSCPAGAPSRIDSARSTNVAEGDRHRYVRPAYQQALALTALSDDLGIIAQLDFDDFTLDRSEFDLAELVHAEVDALRPQAESSPDPLSAGAPMARLRHVSIGRARSRRRRRAPQPTNR